MDQPTYDDVAGRMGELGMEVFDARPFDLTLFGIRSRRRDNADEWDDWLGVLFHDGERDRVVVGPGTTTPGQYALEHPTRSAGVATMLADRQYRGMWELGLHGTSQGRGYPAFHQVGHTAFVRDADRDTVLDVDALARDPSLVVSGQASVVGANGHRASEFRLADVVGRYSYLCQVWREFWVFESILALARAQVAAGWGDRFSYALLNEWRTP